METETSNEFAYLEREFSSEKYKVEISNLGIFGIGDLKSLLKKLELNAVKIKTPRKRDHAFVCFRNQEDCDKALKVLNETKWRGRDLKCKTAKPNADPFQKRKAEKPEHDIEEKKPKPSVESQTVPLANLPYEEQLKTKELGVIDILKTFAKKLKKINHSLNLSHSENGLPCKFTGIKASPVIDGYRNKSEFAIGKNANGEIVVGFKIGSYSDGYTEVGSVDGLPHIPEKVKKAVHTFEEYVRSSRFVPFNPEQNSGHFRQIMIRWSKSTDELMVVVGIYSNNLNETDSDELKSSLRTYYEEHNKVENLCNSLYYQDMGKRESGETYNPVVHLLGEENITDKILNLSFRISPLSFFQINSAAADVLYQSIIEVGAVSANTTVLDICCGTGTIGICIAKYCKNVVGVEIIADAVEDAKYNAKENSIENCKFYAGNADDYIKSMVRELVYGCLNKDELDLLAIVDPPRSGLHSKSIQAIRGALDLKKVVYVACNPKAAQTNWIDLCRPESKSYKGDPFIPKVCLAVDMFPHTNHTEVVILFER